MKEKFDLKKMLEEIKQDEALERPGLKIVSQEEIRRMMEAKPAPPSKPENAEV